MDPQEFFRTLWGDPPPGVINIWRLPDRTSSWHRIIGGINDFLRQHAHEEVYTGVSLADQQKGRFTSMNRIEEKEACAIAGVWADIDVFHAVHTKADRLPPNREEAMEVMAQLPHEPTLIVDSGHGLQYWWLLKRPWVFKDETEWAEARRMVQWWHQMTLKLFDARGWTTDSVYDLSRILRIPGTFNNKVPTEPKEVTAIRTGGPRHEVEEFTKLIPDTFVATLPAPEQRRGQKGRAQYEASATASGLILDPKAQPEMVRLTSLLKANPKFQQSWDQNRPEMKDTSPSGYNMALADAAIRAGWPDQEVVNMLICWRRMHGHDLKLRERYYELTLTRAKEPIQREREQQRLEEVLAQPPEDEPEVLRDSLDRLFGVDIIRIVKYLGDPPTFYMYTEQGDITIGPIANIYNQPKFREAVGAATNIVIPKVSGAAWDKQVQAILKACDDEDIGEASHPNEETRTWVHDYLIERHVRREEEWEKAAQRRWPFLTGGRIRIFLGDFCRWLDTTMGQKLDHRALAQRLRRIGSDPAQVHLQVSGARTTRNVWVLPDVFQPPEPGMDDEDDGPAEPRTRDQDDE